MDAPSRRRSSSSLAKSLSVKREQKKETLAFGQRLFSVTECFSYLMNRDMNGVLKDIFFCLFVVLNVKVNGSTFASRITLELKREDIIFILFFLTSNSSKTWNITGYIFLRYMWLNRLEVSSKVKQLFFKKRSFVPSFRMQKIFRLFSFVILQMKKLIILNMCMETENLTLYTRA